MIPVFLKITGFLSYCKPVELDFSSFDLACISGSNGSGKSSLLDSITWVLFGQARRRDDSIINSHSDAAEVVLEFEYEGSLYRVQRSKPRDKATLLEFFIQDDAGTWRPLTERTLRETEERIRKTLRMDFDTFINASFFLQGKADQFAQQRPNERKRILSNVLGLEVWEIYQVKVSEYRKKTEQRLSEVIGSITEIDSELQQEETRREYYEQLRLELDKLAELRQAKEKELEYARRLDEGLVGQKKMLEFQAAGLQNARSRLEEHSRDLQSRRVEAETFLQRIASAVEIEAGYKRWQDTRTELEKWDELVVNFREVEDRRKQPLTEIEAEKSRLEQERRTFLAQEKELNDQVNLLDSLKTEEEQSQIKVEGLLNKSVFQKDMEKQVVDLREGIAALKVENRSLGEEGKELNDRISRLEQVEGAECPLCGQPLTAHDRDRLVVSLLAQRDDMRQRYVLNREQAQQFETALETLTADLVGFADLENDLRRSQRTVDQLHSRRDQIKASQGTWLAGGALRLKAVEQELSENNYSLQARALLVEIDVSLKDLGYEVTAHDRARLEEQQARVFEVQYRQLETARAALEPLQREIAGLEKQVSEDHLEIQKLESDYNSSLKKYQEDAAGLPDLQQVEAEFYNVKERENRLRMELGGALQKVEIIQVQRQRRQELSGQQEEISNQIARLKTLERALGKDGVPALLIEQALPEIEIQANEILDRLSGGAMSVRFATQKDYKDKNREDKRETLDIIISDASGDREYELFSGGEAFRINFAIRLALSRVLSQRAGARLKTLVIDEGFGSQDAEGRQRLVEAINLVRSDFSKILVITHLEELKEAFPARIEVQKNLSGSEIRVAV